MKERKTERARGRKRDGVREGVKERESYYQKNQYTNQ